LHSVGIELQMEVYSSSGRAAADLRASWGVPWVEEGVRIEIPWMRKTALAQGRSSQGDDFSLGKSHWKWIVEDRHAADRRSV